MESDSVIIHKEDNLGLIDEEWANDFLSDDEIEIAPENDFVPEDADLDHSSHVPSKSQEEKWMDLGLDSFLNSVS